MFAALLGSWILGKVTSCTGLINNAYLFGFVYLFATVISEWGVPFAILHVGAHTNVLSTHVVVWCAH